MALRVKEQFPFAFNSDCRGQSIFLPEQDNADDLLKQPQIPVTLPTFDEMVGRNGVTARGYYDALLPMLRPGELNVLAVHAEVEGLSQLGELRRFIANAREMGWSFVPLGDLLPDSSTLSAGRIVKSRVVGRAGWISCQELTGA